MDGQDRYVLRIVPGNSFLLSAAPFFRGSHHSVSLPPSLCSASSNPISQLYSFFVYHFPWSSVPSLPFRRSFIHSVFFQCLPTSLPVNRFLVVSLFFFFFFLMQFLLYGTRLPPFAVPEPPTVDSGSSLGFILSSNATFVLSDPSHRAQIAAQAGILSLFSAASVIRNARPACSTSTA